ncbi:MAG: RNA polymerase sigma factor [Verrucomicrobia bacterium]|nr:RNA polymerase sigma factor [Verrucomicrobiota bacterium]
MTDTSEFEAFMRRHQDMVYSVALRILARETDAADVSQEVFLRAHAHFAELRDNERAPGWLKAVARNLCLNHLERYRARWRFFSELDNADTGEQFSASLPAPIADSTAHDDETRRVVLERALQRLPAHQRVPLVLYHFEELSYEDIARQLRVSLGKVKTDIYRGRDALRQALQLSAEGELTARHDTLSTQSLRNHASGT